MNHHDRADSAPVFVSGRGRCYRCGCPAANGWACYACVSLGMCDTLPDVAELASGNSNFDFAPSGMGDSEKRAARRKKGR